VSRKIGSWSVGLRRSDSAQPGGRPCTCTALEPAHTHTHTHKHTHTHTHRNVESVLAECAQAGHRTAHIRIDGLSPRPLSLREAGPQPSPRRVPSAAPGAARCGARIGSAAGAPGLGSSRGLSAPGLSRATEVGSSPFFGGAVVGHPTSGLARLASRLMAPPAASDPTASGFTPTWFSTVRVGGCPSGAFPPFPARAGVSCASTLVSRPRAPPGWASLKPTALMCRLSGRSDPSAFAHAGALGMCAPLHRPATNEGVTGSAGRALLAEGAA